MISPRSDTRVTIRCWSPKCEDMARRRTPRAIVSIYLGILVSLVVPGRCESIYYSKQSLEVMEAIRSQSVSIDCAKLQKIG